MKKTFKTLTRGDEVFLITGNRFDRSMVVSTTWTPSCIQVWTGYRCYNVPVNHANANRVKVGHTMLYLAKKQFKRDVVRKLNELTR